MQKRKPRYWSNRNTLKNAFCNGLFTIQNDCAARSYRFSVQRTNPDNKIMQKVYWQPHALWRELIWHTCIYSVMKATKKLKKPTFRFIFQVHHSTSVPLARYLRTSFEKKKKIFDERLGYGGAMQCRKHAPWICETLLGRIWQWTRGTHKKLYSNPEYNQGNARHCGSTLGLRVIEMHFVRCCIVDFFYLLIWRAWSLM